ncbi:hypothetical protein [Streptomyces sp. NPDC049040]|uniref:hypothetical protein n=1 Tax=Streptomyces sp. NPDC049040 TaxID=3365593 RepID=UPI003721C4CD
MIKLATADLMSRRLTVMMFVVTLRVGLTLRLTDVSTVLFGIVGPPGVTPHTAGRAFVTL